MNTTAKLLISSCALGLTLAATAGTAMNGDDTSRITNGGTGFIGVTESVGQPRTMNTRMWTASNQWTSRTPIGAGEASTFVNGQPNQNPDAPSRDSMSTARADLRAMGNSGSTNAAARNPSWGTPD